MIEFAHVSKHFTSRQGEKRVLEDVSFHLAREENVAVVGANGAGKSTLIGLMSGVTRPNSGTILRNGRFSWPMAFAGGFHPMLTGRQNAKFVARIYREDPLQLVEEVEEFSELGRSFDLPINTYSQGMKARLAFGVSISIKFDCYLVDEIIGVGDTRFRNKCRAAFQDRLKESSVIMASHSESGLREFCQSAIHVIDGSVTYFPNLDDCLALHNERMSSPAAAPADL